MTVDAATGEHAETSSISTVERYLDRVAERDEFIRAWAFLDPDLVRAQARALDAESPRSPLHGIPVGIKDIVDTADQPTAYGSSLWSGHRPGRDAEAVRRLRAAGALIFGKTATTEFATYEPARTRNPHNLDHTPGGSSSGSAAAVADGQVPIALGTQTAGSVLRPGSYCGVFTLKPSYGRWSFDGVLPVALSFDTLGAFARHPVWLGAVDHILTAPGQTGEEQTALPATRDLTVGVLRPPWAERAGRDASERLESFAAGLRAHGTTVTEISVPPELAELDDAHTLIMAAEAAAALSDRVGRDGTDGISPRLAEFLAFGRGAEPSRIQHARSILRAARRFLQDAHRRADVLLTLASTGEAPRGLDSTGDPVFNKLASVGGLPAVGLPTGTGATGLPLGVQLIGPTGTDHALVRIATCLTDRVGLAARCPLPEEQR
ncbi:amidase [Nocardia africana]|uniref:Glutamyl-tRNA(Gln) amidotransferase subunit A n=1 Tax=Nocardia africana TaxID=134964 RepID=A0A378WZQ9_9NOCA|nr:amidase [Nocardia africana]MCC3312417.1 amidase [Nocardia africana]SUA46267.1 Glutamyl-tRNA(Gln) amidotransferase subunit A [Nocardia africana]